jgi:hypothetical protein
MAETRFHLVSGILREGKYFDISVPEIIRAIESEEGQAEIFCDHCTVDEGVELEVPLRLRIGGSVMEPESWQVALLMHSVRIDGIDDESFYFDADGQEREGWHRHEWDRRENSCEREKRPIAGLDDCPSLEIFLYEVFRQMRIRWNKVDHGTLFDN